ncbi:MAG: S8 family serine peptidase [Candidatus Aenigmarchaeota archaeon]|nr:S8 family serine peptidase [Candidatus Aenigmarchaeota archaeon]
MEKIKIELGVLIAAIIAILLIAGTIAIASNGNGKVTPKKTMIISFDKKPTSEQIAKLKELGARITYQYSITPKIAVKVSEDLIPLISEIPGVVSVGENKQVHALLDVSVPLIEANKVWAEGITGQGVKVCIVDTGVDYNHPALAGKLNSSNPNECYTFLGNGAIREVGCMDDNGHGTHVAGIVASTDSTYKGVAYGASLAVAKVLDSQGSGYYVDVMAGIDWCVNNAGADIISMSLGGSSGTEYACDTNDLAATANSAVDSGLVAIAAAGNDGAYEILTPACGSKVIAVGANNDAKEVVWWSNRGEQLDLVAPGVDIMSCEYNTAGFVEKSGTSMSTPHVSGVAALLLETDPTLAPLEIKAILNETAYPPSVCYEGRRIGRGLVLVKKVECTEAVTGGGIVNASAAYERVKVVDTTPPTITIETPASGSVTNSQVVSFTVKDNVDVDESTIVVKINGAISAVFNATTDCTAGTTSVPCSYTEAGIVEGSNTLTVDANDTSANAATQASSTFTYDVTSPTITNSTGNTEATTGEPVTISAIITDNVKVDSATVYYTPIDGTETSVAMKEQANNLWNASIPVDENKVGTITYHIVAKDTATNEARDPTTGEYNIKVTDNDPPVADAGPDQSAYVNEIVTFDGSGSTDNIGIVSYEWDFESDGTVDATGVKVNHTYTAVGNYTVTLTVKDAAGNSANDTALVTVTEKPAMHVASIDVVLISRSRGWNYYAEATVTIVDAYGNPVGTATVYGEWSGATTDKDSGDTDAEGKVTFQSDSVWKPASGTTFTFCVTSVTKTGWQYDELANVETCDSVTVP